MNLGFRLGTIGVLCLFASAIVALDAAGKDSMSDNNRSSIGMASEKISGQAQREEIAIAIEQSQTIDADTDAILREAWVTMLAKFEQAREAIDDAS